MRRREKLEVKIESEQQRMEAEWQRMEAERQRMELQMFEYMRGVYAAIGQPPPPIGSPSSSTCSKYCFRHCESLYNLTITVSSLCRINLTKMPRH